jgi:hypothetical protein
MQIDTEHLHYWMQAIRQSSNPMRTMDAFWSGQIKSKEWLIEQLRPHVFLSPVSVDIHGGWVGVLASMLFQSNIPIKNIRSVDIDPDCKITASTMNKQEEIDGRFCAVTADMCQIRSDADVVINTSCEHITQEQYDIWLSGLPQNSLIVLQSNNYDIPEHVRWCKDFDEFKSQSNLKLLWGGELPTQLYTRYMIIGRKQ